jgi:hypothetical protein
VQISTTWSAGSGRRRYRWYIWWIRRTRRSHHAGLHRQRFDGQRLGYGWGLSEVGCWELDPDVIRGPRAWGLGPVRGFLRPGGQDHGYLELLDGLLGLDGRRSFGLRWKPQWYSWKYFYSYFALFLNFLIIEGAFDSRQTLTVETS